MNGQRMCPSDHLNPMRKIPLRRLLSKLTALALTASPAAAVAGPSAPPVARDVDTDLDGDLASDLSIDGEHMDPRDAAATLGRSLALALSELRPLAGTHLATTWALADDPVRRLAVAHSLEWAFPLFGDIAILDHLSYDTDPAIRAAVAHPLFSQGKVAPETLQQMREYLSPRRMADGMLAAYRRVAELSCSVKTPAARFDLL